MRDVAESLRDKALKVLWVEIPGLPKGGDIADYIESLRGGGLRDDEIRKKIDELLEKAEEYDPKRFSLLGKLCLDPGRSVAG